jgi:Leucine-rich repeat (LRR) protein
MQQSLTKIDLSHNLLSIIDEFRPCSIINVADDESVSTSTEKDGEEWIEIIKRNSSIQDELFRPLTLRTSMGADSSSMLHNQFYGRPIPGSLSAPFSEANITILELDNCDLTSLEKLPSNMPNLKWASFNKNHLVDITRLSDYNSLTEISLSHNDIGSIDCLSVLPLLEKLDVANNQISIIGLPGFISLLTLCLSNNNLESFSGIPKIKSLKELCNTFP